MRPTSADFSPSSAPVQTIDTATGEKRAISKRCADVNVQVPLMLGVSKAILENVIFVHQDDANWPLGEPASLKKKFDDIFAATRYTKALEAIAKLKKDKSVDVKEKKAQLETLKAHKETAARLRQQMAEAADRKRELEAEIAAAHAASEAQHATINRLQRDLGEHPRATPPASAPAAIISWSSVASLKTTLAASQSGESLK